jgi:hypothetical protein
VLVSCVVGFELNGAESAHDMVGVIRIVLFELNLVVKVLLEGVEVEVTVLAILVVDIPNLVALHSSLALEFLEALWKGAGNRFCHDVAGHVRLRELKKREKSRGEDECWKEKVWKKKCDPEWLLWVEICLKAISCNHHADYGKLLVCRNKC